MKDWQIWLLLALVGVNLYITYRIASGLQSAQAQVAKITNPLSEFGKLIGL